MGSNQTLLVFAQDVDVRVGEYIDCHWESLYDFGVLKELGPRFYLESMVEVRVLLDIMSLTIGCWATHVWLPANEKWA